MAADLPGRSAADVEYKAAVLSKDQRTLTLFTATGEIQAPRTEEDQAGFADAQISPDRSTVGWLATVGNCCTSYPLPLILVLYRDGKVVQRLDESRVSIWKWAFVHDGTAIAYRAAFPHGFAPTFYKLRSSSDGRILDEFSCGADPARGIHETSGPEPGWVKPLREDDCPD